jgi:hypothetical protein
MDQLKDLLRQCVKYRFWIAFSLSLILPIIGYFVGVGGIVEAKTKAETSIKTAKTAISKFSSRGLVNGQYQPEVVKKNLILTQDVDDSWRKLRSLQEPLLRWPEEVEAKFLRWGRKFPEDVDRLEVQRTLTDYTYAYPNFISKIYKIFKPFNYEDGTGIVVAPDEKALLKPAPFLTDNPPELSRVWAEQDRLWVLSALLDAVAKINDTVQAKDWEGAIVKQLVMVEVGSPNDQDQKSLADAIQLVPSDVLLPAGAPPPPIAAPPGGSLGGAPGVVSVGPSSGGPSGNGATPEDIFYLKTDSKQFKVLPFKMTVLVDQAKLADFLVGLENSPITIEVKESEVSRPLATVTKPEKGEQQSSGGMGFGLRPGDTQGRGRMGGVGRPPGTAGPVGGPARGGPTAIGGPGMGGRNGTAAAAKGTDTRSNDARATRKETNKESEKKVEKIKHDQYYNVVEVTVYGQARFYLAPPPLPAGQPSTAVAAPSPAPGVTKEEEPTKKDEPSKADESMLDASKPAAPKPDASKSDGPKGDAPTPKS